MFVCVFICMCLGCMCVWRQVPANTVFVVTQSRLWREAGGKGVGCRLPWWFGDGDGRRVVVYERASV